jgi:hypothetical protein
MTTPEVTRRPDGHFQRVVYGLGPYIADYPEQALLACIVQGWCPRYVLFTILFLSFSQLSPTRCTANNKDLDGEAGRRSRDHTELLVSEFELGVLWDEYGLVGDIIVGYIICIFVLIADVKSNSHSQMTSLGLISTNSSRLISYTKLSKGHSRIIWLAGLNSTSFSNMVR